MKQSLTVRWKKYDSSEYYSYNPETGILYILVNLPKHKGYHVRSDENSGEIYREFQAEIQNKVPVEKRLYAECALMEYVDAWTASVTFTNDTFRTSLFD